MDNQSRSLSNEMLIGAADHLFNEINMSKETVKAMADPQEKPWVLANSLVESFVIHIRSLIMFLYIARRPGMTTLPQQTVSMKASGRRLAPRCLHGSKLHSIGHTRKSPT
ncbi:MAG: hypothetical protein WBR18_01975 [Anaerolineales bacterium]